MPTADSGRFLERSASSVGTKRAAMPELDKVPAGVRRSRISERLLLLCDVYAQVSGEKWGCLVGAHG
jgi:hypothetical protein